MSRPALPKGTTKQSIGITLSPRAMKIGHAVARKRKISFSAVVDEQLLKLRP